MRKKLAQGRLRMPVGGVFWGIEEIPWTVLSVIQIVFLIHFELAPGPSFCREKLDANKWRKVQARIVVTVCVIQNT